MKGRDRNNYTRRRKKTTEINLNVTEGRGTNRTVNLMVCFILGRLPKRHTRKSDSQTERKNVENELELDKNKNIVNELLWSL